MHRFFENTTLIHTNIFYTHEGTGGLLELLSQLKIGVSEEKKLWGRIAFYAVLTSSSSSPSTTISLVALVGLKEKVGKSIKQAGASTGVVGSHGTGLGGHHTFHVRTFKIIHLNEEYRFFFYLW